MYGEITVPKMLRVKLRAAGGLGRSAKPELRVG